MQEHAWQTGRFTGAMTCERCGLLPLDDDDMSTLCGYSDEEVSGAFEHYLACALWTGLYEPADSWDDAQPEPLDGHADVDDVPDDARDELRTDWDDFVSSNVRDIDEYMRVTGTDLGQVAHDFHLTRNGHGAGFWDRDAGDVGERLSEAARVYGTAELMGFPADDGVSIYVSN